MKILEKKNFSKKNNIKIIFALRQVLNIKYLHNKLVNLHLLIKVNVKVSHLTDKDVSLFSNLKFIISYFILTPFVDLKNP